MRVRTRKLCLMSSFRASHNDISIGNISAFTKKSHDHSSESRRSAPSRSVPAPTRAADIRPMSNVAAAHQIPHQAPPGILDSEPIILPSTEPILLPFTARLGERPLSGFPRETSKFNKHAPSVVVGKNTRGHAAHDDQRQQPGSKKLQGSAAGDVVLSRPQTAPEIPKSQRTFGALQSSRTQQLVGPPSPAKAPPLVMVPNVSPSRGTKRIETPDRLQAVRSDSKNEASELQGAELEVLLKKQLELVSRASLTLQTTSMIVNSDCIHEHRCLHFCLRHIELQDAVVTSKCR
jgi:hypothetical protein